MAADVTGEREEPDNGDWTEKVPQILVRACRSCPRRWYVRRGFCPRCGSEKVSVHASEGAGTVVASTVVYRHPLGIPETEIPFGIVLVDLDEGIRVMGRAAPGRRPGDRVAVNFTSYGRGPVPFFELR